MRSIGGGLDSFKFKLLSWFMAQKNENELETREACRKAHQSWSGELGFGFGFSWGRVSFFFSSGSRAEVERLISMRVLTPKVLWPSQARCWNLVCCLPSPVQCTVPYRAEISAMAMRRKEREGLLGGLGSGFLRLGVGIWVCVALSVN